MRWGALGSVRLREPPRRALSPSRCLWIQRGHLLRVAHSGQFPGRKVATTLEHAHPLRAGLDDIVAAKSVFSPSPAFLTIRTITTDPPRLDRPQVNRAEPGLVTSSFEDYGLRCQGVGTTSLCVDDVHRRPLADIDGTQLIGFVVSEHQGGHSRTPFGDNASPIREPNGKCGKQRYDGGENGDFI